MEIKAYLDRQRRLVEDGLRRFIPEPKGPFQDIIEAMRYSLFVGGKRVRPILCLAAARAVNDAPDIEERLLPLCCALECIHTYSLIHDDLPAMDDDDLRRGQPTNHMVFGEAAAILAGDGLLTLAFELLSRPDEQAISGHQRLRIMHIIARGAGYNGMVGGQALDIAHEGKSMDYDQLQTMHRAKTGRLIIASVQSGAVAGGCTDEQLQALTEYGRHIGLGFQIADDLLNVEATTEQLGKAAGSDVRRGKVTYPALVGVDRSHALAREAIDQALDALTIFGKHAEPLRCLARYIIERKR